MTLVEVVAGLVLLATVFAAVAVARGRFVRQWSDADRQLRATRAADALLAGWLGGPPGMVPVRGSGPLADADGFRWQTRPVRESAAERLEAQVVRLEVFGPPGAEAAGSGSPAPQAAEARQAAPVLVVDFLLRVDAPTTGDATTARGAAGVPSGVPAGAGGRRGEVLE
jgi:hypothetical protein